MGIKLPFRYRKGGYPASEYYRVVQSYGRVCTGTCINLEKNGRLHFCLFRHDWPEPALFWIPVDFTERLPAPLKDIVRGVHPAICPASQAVRCYRDILYDFAIEELEDWKNRDSDASRRTIRANRRLADSYQSGKRMKALRRMGQTVLQVFGRAVSELPDKKEKELKLLELIGTAWITPESPV